MAFNCAEVTRKTEKGTSSEEKLFNGSNLCLHCEKPNARTKNFKFIRRSRGFPHSRVYAFPRREARKSPSIYRHRMPKNTSAEGNREKR